MFLTAVLSTLETGPQSFLKKEEKLVLWDAECIRHMCLCVGIRKCISEEDSHS